MLFLLLFVVLWFCFYKITERLSNSKVILMILSSFSFALSICIMLCGIVTEIYYSTDLPDILYEQIEVHPKTPIDIVQYINQEPVVLMDKDYNLHHIDLEQAEITFSTNNNAAYIKTLKAKGLWKFILFDHSRTSYAVQFMDYYARNSS